MKRGAFIGVLCLVGSSFLSALTVPTASAQSVGWGTPELVEHHYAGHAVIPDVGIDAAGNAVAVWTHTDGGRDDNRASRYVAGVGWTPPVLIESDDGPGYASYPLVAVSPSGDALATWRQNNGSLNSVWANRYVVGTGWGNAGPIETSDAEPTTDPDVAIDAAGNGIVVWTQDTLVYGHVFANRYVVGTGWGTAERVDTNDNESSELPHVAVDSTGNAMVVWQQSNGSVFNSWSRRYVVGIGWGSPERIDMTSPGSGMGPRLAVDPSGNATALWTHWNGTVSSLLANRYVVGTGWGAVAYVESNDLGNVYTPDVAVDPSGNAVAVWRQWDGAWYSIWANRHVVGIGWGTAQLIESTDLETAILPQVAVDAGGNAVAVWYQQDGGESNTWANRYVVGTGWGTAELIEPIGNGFVEEPRIAVDPSGNATAVWSGSELGSVLSVWANRYTVGTGWGVAGLVERDPYDVLEADLAVGPGGDAIAVWTQNDGVGNELWSSRYVVGTGWGTPEFTAGGPYGPNGAQVAVDPSGNAMAVWSQSDNGSGSNIRASRYVVGTGWGASEYIETGAGFADSPQVAVDPSGNAVAVWQQDDTASSIWANRYVVGTGWGAAELLETNAGGAFDPQVAVDPSGNAVAVWYQTGGTRESAWANRYVVGTGWGTAEILETDNTGNAASPRVAVDAAGNAIVVWQQYDGSTFWDIWGNRYAVGTGWGTGGPIEPDAASDGNPQVVVDPSGNAVAVWARGGPTISLWASRYVVGTGWGTPGLVETNDTGDISSPFSVAIGPSGSAVVVWPQSGAVENIWANRYVVGTGWGTPELLETDDTGDSDEPVVGVDSAGNAVAVWRQFDGAFWNLWSNRFTADATLPIADAGPDQSVATGTLVTFDGSGSTDNVGVTNYTWTFADAGARTLYGVSPAYRFNNVGTFVVTLTVRDAEGNSDPDTVTITVSLAPDTQPPVADAGPDQVVLAGMLVTFDGSGSTDNVGVTNYTWTFADGGARTLYGVTPAYRFNNVGTFLVTLTARDAAGNSDTDTLTIMANPDPVPPVADAGPDQTVVAGTLVTFDGSGSTDNIAVTNYTWTFDDGGTRNLYGVGPTHRFDNVGTFGVTLTVGDAAGNFDTDVVVITVPPPPDTVPPVANAGGDWAIVAGTTIVLDGAASMDNVGIVNYTWSFTDVGVKTRYTPTFAYQFNNVGVFTIVLTVRDAAGNSDTDTVVVTVSSPPDTEPPVADAGLDRFVATGSIVVFSGSSSTDNVGVVNYTWSFSDGGPQTLYGASPAYRFDNVGAFVITLMVRDAAGNSDSDVLVVAVTLPPDTVPPVADAGAGRTILAGTTTILDGSASTDDVGIVNYTWTFNDGVVQTRYTATFAYTFNNVGTFTITLAVRDAAGNSDSDAVAITVLPPDTEPPVGDAGPDRSVVVGTVVTFDGSGSTDNVGVTNFTWTFDDGGTRTLYGTSPTHAFDNVGAFVVILFVRDAAGNIDSDAVVIAVTSPPDTEPPVAEGGPDQSVNTDVQVVLDGTASTDNVGVTNYTWTFTYDGTTRTLYGPIVAFRFSIAGTYAVTLAVRDAATNVDTDTVTITSTARPGGEVREVVPPLAIAGVGIVAILEVALALRWMSHRLRGPGVPKAKKAKSKGRDRKEEAPAKKEPEPPEEEDDLAEDEDDL